MRRVQPRSGFTLVEVLITLLLLGTSMAIAAGLLGESARILAHSVSRARNPQLTLGLEQLKNDVLAAQTLPAAPLFDWQQGPLDLVDASGTLRRWSRSAGLLERHTAGAGDEPEGRPVLDQVVAFRWRVRPAGLLEVELQVEMDVERYVRHATATRIRRGERSLRSEHLLLSPRRLALGGGR